MAGQQSLFDGPPPRPAQPAPPVSVPSAAKATAAPVAGFFLARCPGCATENTITQGATQIACGCGVSWRP